MLKLKMKFRCHWDDKRICKRDLNCVGCKYQPADDDKPNGRKPPALIQWEQDGGGIAPMCPTCGEMPYSLERCIFCGQIFIKDDQTREWEKPQEPEYIDCIICGGKGTMQYTRSHVNGHKHGHCTACGARFIE